jgi:hypothetical protein
MNSLGWHLQMLADFTVVTYVLTWAIASAAGRAVWEMLVQNRRTKARTSPLAVAPPSTSQQQQQHRELATIFHSFCAHIWMSVDVTVITTRLTVAVIVPICKVALPWAKSAYRGRMWILLLFDWLLIGLVVSLFCYLGSLLYAHCWQLDRKVPQVWWGSLYFLSNCGTASCQVGTAEMVAAVHSMLASRLTAAPACTA